MGVRHRSLRFGVPQVLLVASLAAGAYLAARSRPEIRREIGREKAALKAVRSVALSEHEFLARRLRDENKDRVPEYGRLADLSAAGLYSRALSTDADGAWSEVEGYRLEVLLPDGHDRTGRTTLARSAKPDAADLSAGSFAVVATPRRGALSGRSSYYLDADGRLYMAEGICQVDGDPVAPPPPRALKEKDEDLGPDGPVWRLREGPAAK